MRQRKIRFFQYRGSKHHLIEAFNDLMQQSNKKIYVEPFVGSGAIFINLADKFEHYIINDIDENIISMYNSVVNFNYKDFVDIKDFIFDKFGSIEVDKESYYEYRNFYNEIYHSTDKKERGIFLYFLANSCINSLLRFGPNGMNQSFGERFYFFDENTFNTIKDKLNKTTIENKDYREIELKSSLVYLDPPYFGTLVSYKSEFESHDQIDLINYIKENSLTNDIFYSDLENEVSDQLLQSGFQKISTKKIKNVSPNRFAKGFKENKTKNEVMYYNV